MMTIRSRSTFSWFYFYFQACCLHPLFPAPWVTAPTTPLQPYATDYKALSRPDPVFTSVPSLPFPVHCLCLKSSYLRYPRLAPAVTPSGLCSAVPSSESLSQIFHYKQAPSLPLSHVLFCIMCYYLSFYDMLTY